MTPVATGQTRRLEHGSPPSSHLVVSLARVVAGSSHSDTQVRITRQLGLGVDVFQVATPFCEFHDDTW